jgi:tRNA-binding protein
MIEYTDFQKVEIRAGTIVSAEEFPEARNPAYKLTIDFGDKIGIKKSSAQITDYYKPKDLIGKQICAVTNFHPKQIGPFISEVLVLGFTTEENKISLISPNHKTPNGSLLH